MAGKSGSIDLNVFTDKSNELKLSVNVLLACLMEQNTIREHMSGGHNTPPW